MFKGIWKYFNRKEHLEIEYRIPIESELPFREKVIKTFSEDGTLKETKTEHLF